MAWTYDPSQIATNRKDELRLMLGDTDSTDPILQDEELTYFASLYPAPTGKPPYLAAAQACDAIAFAFAREVQNSIGPLSESAQQKYEHYVALSQQMRVLHATGGKGIIPGTMAGITPASPVLGGGGRTYLGGTPYTNPEGL